MDPANPREHTNKKWYKRWWGILIIVIGLLIFLLIAGFSLLVYSALNQGNNNPAVSGESEQVEINTKNNPWTGSANGDITIVEFADFACLHSHEAFPVIRRITRERDDVKLVFKDYPVVSEMSLDLAMAGRCAAAQDKFWQMHDRLFMADSISSKADIYSLARKTGVDTDQFRSCMENEKFLDEIKKDAQEADSLGITGTPTWFINGYKIEGNAPYKTFQQAIESIKNKQ